MPASVPNIVASGNFVNQMLHLARRFYTPPAASGLFRISAYYEKTGTGGVNPSFGWTSDLVGAVSYNDGQLQAGSTFMGVFDVQSSANPITLSVGQSGSPTWSLYYTIEQLQ